METKPNGEAVLGSVYYRVCDLAANGSSGCVVVLQEDSGYSEKPWSPMKIVQS